jgi:hypothetical protein
MSEQIGISVTNACYHCYMLNEVCIDCEDKRQANDAIFAHELVDDGNDIYRYAPMYTSMTKIEAETSGHEWVSSTTLGTWYDPKAEREEFVEPITNLSDRFFELVVDLGPHETVCQDCHMVCNKHAVCPSCN